MFKFILCLSLIVSREGGASSAPPYDKIDSEYFSGVGEIVVWASRELNLDSVWDDDLISSQKLNDKCLSLVKSKLSKDIKKSVMVLSTKEVDVKPLRTQDESKLFINCYIKYDNAQVSNNAFVVGYVVMRMWRPIPEGLQNNDRVSGFPKHLTRTFLPFVFISENQNLLENALDEALDEASSALMKNINAHEFE